jgi:hypothetical protein
MDRDQRIAMQKIKTGFLFVLASLALFGAHPQTAFACSCMAPGSPKEELAQMTAVFSGRVELIERSQEDRSRGIVGPVRVVFKVDRVWKGPARKTIAIHTFPDGAGCGYEFETGADYLVYGRESENEIIVSLCSRTARLATASDDIGELGDGQAPVSDNPGASPGPSAASAWMLQTIVITGIALAVAAGLRLRRQRR